MKYAARTTLAALILAAGVAALYSQETQPPAKKKVDKAEVARIMRCQLPEGKGKETVVRLCSDCHAARVVTSARKTQDQWLQTVEAMAEKGINASDDDFTTVVEYLSANLAPDNNQGSTAPKKDAAPAAKADECPKQPETAPPSSPQK